MEEKIKEIMALIFKCDASVINDDTSPDNLEEWDSLRHINLVVALEEEFGVNFSEDEIVDMMNFKLMKIIIKEKVDAKK